jgi:hypothetical protein
MSDEELIAKYHEAIARWQPVSEAADLAARLTADLIRASNKLEAELESFRLECVKRKIP